MAQDREQPQAVSQPAAARPRPIRWRSGLGILLAGAVAEAAVLGLYADDATLKVYVTLKFVFPIVTGLLILWWLFRSGFSWRIRTVGVLIVLLGVAVFSLRYRIDGFTGAMLPIISLRSAPTPEQRIANYFKTAPRTAPLPRQDNGGDAAAGGRSSSTGPLEITGDDWPRFRGARGDGVVRGETIRTDWQADPPKPLWQHPAGPAWSSFAAVGELLFTQEQRGDDEAVVCYEAASGRVVWLHLDKNERYSTLMGGTGPRATPTIHDSRVYTLGATGVLNCLDARTGRRHWSKNILKDAGPPDEPAQNLDWGMAGSPLVFDDVVVVNPGGDAGKSVIAYDRLTGKEKWAAGENRAGYASVQLATLHGRPQLLIYDSAGVAGYDPEGAGELWRFEWTNSDRINVAQPIVRDKSLVFISSGYGTGSALLDVTETGKEKWSVEPRWKKPGHFKLKFNDAVYQDGYLYGLDEGILACIEFETGKMMWKRGRYGHGQMLLIGDMNLLLIQAEAGDVALVPATPGGYEEIGRFTALDAVTWNHPMLNRGRLYVRNAQQAACYDLRRTNEVNASE